MKPATKRRIGVGAMLTGAALLASIAVGVANGDLDGDGLERTLRRFGTSIGLGVFGIGAHLRRDGRE